jgi:signal transduction histidine kinase
MSNFFRFGLWSALAAGALALGGLLAFCLADGGNIERLAIRAPNVHHILASQRWMSPSHDWNPPASLDETDDQVLAPGRAWRTVTLPDLRRQQSTLPETLAWGDKHLESPQVVWFRFALPNPPPGDGALISLYIPHLSINGSAAIYLDGRRIWMRPTRFVFQPYYDPVLVQLPGASPRYSRPRIIYLRMTARAQNGGVLSSLWTGSGDILLTAWRIRTFLQTGVIWWAWSAYSVLGALSFLIWRRRRDMAGNRIYLWFTLNALLVPALVAPSLSGSFTDVPEPFLLWLCHSGVFLASICIVNFNAEAIGRRQPVLERIVWFQGLAGASLETIYVLRYGSSLPVLHLSDRLILLTLVPGFLPIIHAITGMIKFRTPMSVVIGMLYFLVLISNIHDFLYAANAGGAEDLLFTPFFSRITLIIYSLYLFQSYVRAVEGVEQANENLQTALVSKEAELAITHQQLLDFQRDQTLTQERQRMMQEMHDGIGASLISALRYLKHGQKDASAVAQVLEECIDDLKLSIDSLEPVDGDLLLLLSSLRFRLGSRLQGSGIKLHWNVAELPLLPWLDAQHGMHVLRILQEILTNLLKHSSADTLRFSTAVADHGDVCGIVICIADNGKPFTPPAPERIPAARKGLGNILSRARHLDGHCQWQPRNDGNRFILWLPLARDVHPAM